MVCQETVNNKIESDESSDDLNVAISEDEQLENDSDLNIE